LRSKSVRRRRCNTAISFALKGSQHKAERSALCWDRGRAREQVEFCGQQNGTKRTL